MTRPDPAAAVVAVCITAIATLLGLAIWEYRNPWPCADADAHVYLLPIGGGVLMPHVACSHSQHRREGSRCICPSQEAAR